jgi:hypothetical protein
MAGFLGRFGDVVTGLSPSVVIGSLIIALTLSLVASGIHTLAWRGKGQASLASLAGVMFLVSIVSMAIAIGYTRPSRRNFQGRPLRTGQPMGPIPRARAIPEAADRDKAVNLSPREISESVRKQEPRRNGHANVSDIDHVSPTDPPKPSMTEGTGVVKGIPQTP